MEAGLPCMAEDLAECAQGALVLTSARAAISASIIRPSSMVAAQLFSLAVAASSAMATSSHSGLDCTVMDGATAAAAAIGTAAPRVSDRAIAPHTPITSAIKRL